MLLALWPLFLMDDTSAVDTPELAVMKEDVDLTVVSIDDGEMVVKDT